VPHDAIAIAEQIWDCRLYTAGGNITWAGPTGYGTDLSPLKRIRLGPYLYDGTTGIALFLASLERFTEAGRYRGFALQAVDPVRRKIADLLKDPERFRSISPPLGGLIGLGSLVYAFLKMGEWLQEPELIREAHAATGLVTQERIAEDRQVRIQTGCSGAILVLLALHKSMPCPNSAGHTPLDLAKECARHLLATRISLGSGPRAWMLSPGKPPLAGFSYGAAGSAYALLRLFELCGEPEFRDAAKEGLSFVRSLYSPLRRSWRDPRVRLQREYRLKRGTWKDWWSLGTLDDLEPLPITPIETDEGDHFPTSWCHGSSGIALGRLSALPIDDTPEARQEIQGVVEDVLRSTRGTELDDEPDDLCCGHAGRVELLLGAYRYLRDEECLEAARELMRRMRLRAEARGGYQLSAARGTEIFAPSLFQGLAGIGFTLLRVAEPQSLPSLLLLE
jgi:lantibiotic modifying enzyme